jgi:hypothetical protein
MKQISRLGKGFDLAIRVSSREVASYDTNVRTFVFAFAPALCVFILGCGREAQQFGPMTLREMPSKYLYRCRRPWFTLPHDTRIPPNADGKHVLVVSDPSASLLAESTDLVRNGEHDD